MGNGEKMTMQEALVAAKLYSRQNKEKFIEDVLQNNEKIKDFQDKKNEISDFLSKNEKNPLIKEYIKLYSAAEKKPHTQIGRITQRMKEAAIEQQTLKMAIELCGDEDGKKVLIGRYNRISTGPAMTDYAKYIEGMKFYAGMTKRHEVSKDVEVFFKKDLRLPFFTNGTDMYDIYETYRDSGEESRKKEEQLEAHGEEGLKLIEEYQTKVAKAKARELFTRQQVHFAGLDLQFFGKPFEEMAVKNHPDPFTGRMTPSGFCVGMLLKEGKSIEEIMDPTALIEDKIRAGKEYDLLYSGQKAEEYGEKMHEYGAAIVKSIQQYIKDHKEELKTEDDLAMHADKFGMLCYYALDYVQELPKCKPFVSETYKVRTDDLLNSLGKYVFGAGPRTFNAIPYDPYECKRQILANTIEAQIGIKKMLDEIQKDDPDFEKNCLGQDQRGYISDQIDTIEEVDELFGEDELNVDEAELDDAKVKRLASMHSLEFIETNKFSFEHAKMSLVAGPTTFKNPDAAKKYETDPKVELLVLRDKKPVIKVELPVMNHLKNLDEKLRGEAKGNSAQFNAMADACDKVGETPDKLEKSNADLLKEMRELKKAATEYILAKRAQKGYTTGAGLKVPDAEIDKNMLGKGKGASIFTTRGKERYEYALKIVESVIEMEKELQKNDPEAYKAAEEAEIKNPEIDEPENEM